MQSAIPALIRSFSRARLRSGAVLAGILALVALLNTSLFAQPGSLPTTSGSSTSGTARGDRRLFGEGGTLMIEVNVWGYVRSPGKYTVPISSRLLDVISLAGGPAERADLEEVKVVHDRNTLDSNVTELVRVIDLEEYQETGNPTANPVLNANDTIIIPGDNLNSVNQILSVVSNVAVVTLSIVGLIFAFQSK